MSTKSNQECFIGRLFKSEYASRGSNRSLIPQALVCPIYFPRNALTGHQSIFSIAIYCIGYWVYGIYEKRLDQCDSI